MKYNYNGNLTFEERIIEISTEIIDKYNISKNLSIKIATLEPIINDSIYNPQNEFRRLYNILYIIKDIDKTKYNEVLKDLYILTNKYFNDIKCKENYIFNKLIENGNMSLEYFNEK